MTITISEKETTVIERILHLLRQEKVAFKIEKRASEPSLNDEDIVWDWEDVDDIEFSKFALSQIADDWNSPFDDHWGELYLQTKNLEPI
jgi:hypothetical protein